MDYNPALFKKESYLITKYDLIREVYTTQVFFLTLLTV